jgi:hypothetical protein
LTGLGVWVAEMEEQKRKNQEKAYEQQQKDIAAAKRRGQSKVRPARHTRTKHHSGARGNQLHIETP